MCAPARIEAATRGSGVGCPWLSGLCQEGLREGPIRIGYTSLGQLLKPRQDLRVLFLAFPEAQPGSSHDARVVHAGLRAR